MAGALAVGGRAPSASTPSPEIPDELTVMATAIEDEGAGGAITDRPERHRANVESPGAGRADTVLPTLVVPTRSCRRRSCRRWSCLAGRAGADVSAGAGPVRCRSSRRSRRGGPASAGPAEAGPVEARPVEAGPVEAGPVEAGPAQRGPASAESRDADGVSSNGRAANGSVASRRRLRMATEQPTSPSARPGSSGSPRASAGGRRGSKMATDCGPVTAPGADGSCGAPQIPASGCSEAFSSRIPGMGPRFGARKLPVHLEGMSFALFRPVKTL